MQRSHSEESHLEFRARGELKHLYGDDMIYTNTLTVLGECVCQSES